MQCVRGDGAVEKVRQCGAGGSVEPVPSPLFLEQDVGLSGR